MQNRPLGNRQEHGNSLSRSRTARFCALVLALALLLVAVAIYSPLHRHEAGNPYRCSLNNIEHCVTEEAVAVFVLLVAMQLVVWLVAAKAEAPRFRAVPLRACRAPPASLGASPLACCA